MEEKIYEDFINAYQQADMILIGIGDELKGLLIDETANSELLQFYASCIEKKNFFIITSITDKNFSLEGINPKRIVSPLLFNSEELSADDKQQLEKQWDLYNKWLSATLNKKLLILELGEGFLNPNVFRWPFEKVTFINQKAEFFRVNKLLPQIPENICERAHSVNCSSYDFLVQLKDFALCD